MNVAILDDCQNVALKMADWSSVARRAKITVFNDYVADPDAVVERLLPFVICVMRERTPLPRGDPLSWLDPTRPGDTLRS